MSTFLETSGNGKCAETLTSGDDQANVVSLVKANMAALCLAQRPPLFVLTTLPFLQGLKPLGARCLASAAVP